MQSHGLAECSADSKTVTQDHLGRGAKTIQNELRFAAVVAAKSGADKRSRNKPAFCRQVRDETIASQSLLTDSNAHECDNTDAHSAKSW